MQSTKKMELPKNLHEEDIVTPKKWLSASRSIGTESTDCSEITFGGLVSSVLPRLDRPLAANSTKDITAGSTLLKGFEKKKIFYQKRAKSIKTDDCKYFLRKVVT